MILPVPIWIVWCMIGLEIVLGFLWLNERGKRINLERKYEKPEPHDPQFFTHIREGIAIVKDWIKNP